MKIFDNESGQFTDQAKTIVTAGMGIGTLGGTLALAAICGSTPGNHPPLLFGAVNACAAMYTTPKLLDFCAGFLTEPISAPKRRGAALLGAGIADLVVSVLASPTGFANAFGYTTAGLTIDTITHLLRPERREKILGLTQIAGAAIGAGIGVATNSSPLETAALAGLLLVGVDFAHSASRGK